MLIALALIYHSDHTVYTWQFPDFKRLVHPKKKKKSSSAIIYITDSYPYQPL